MPIEGDLQNGEGQDYIVRKRDLVGVGMGSLVKDRPQQSEETALQRRLRQIARGETPERAAERQKMAAAEKQKPKAEPEETKELRGEVRRIERELEKEKLKAEYKEDKWEATKWTGSTAISVIGCVALVIECVQSAFSGNLIIAVGSAGLAAIAAFAAFQSRIIWSRAALDMNETVERMKDRRRKYEEGEGV
jgi:hypothetical protein